MAISKKELKLSKLSLEDKVKTLFEKDPDNGYSIDEVIEHVSELSGRTSPDGIIGVMNAVTVSTALERLTNKNRLDKTFHKGKQYYWLKE